MVLLKGQGKRFLSLLACFFVPGEILVDGISESKVERLDGLTLEDDEVFDVGNLSLKELSIFIIGELSNIAFVFHSHFLNYLACGHQAQRSFYERISAHSEI